MITSGKMDPPPKKKIHLLDSLRETQLRTMLSFLINSDTTYYQLKKTHYHTTSTIENHFPLFLCNNARGF